MMKLDVAKWNEKQRILATVAYFDVFDLALRSEEIDNLILGEQIEAENLNKYLIGLEELECRNGMFVLKGREELFEMREKKIAQEEKLKRKVSRSIWLMKWIPFVRGVAVCNYLAIGAVDAESDIDLLVVVKSGRIFLARVWLTLLMQIFGLRRHGNKIAGRFCLSFYVSEDNLDFEKIAENPYDIYLIYWLKALWPVYGDNVLFKKIEKENQWVNKYLNWSLSVEENLVGKNWLVGLNEWILSGKIGDWFEAKFSEYFQTRNKSRSLKLPENASVVVNEKMLKYHNNDKRAFFREEWEKRLERLKFSS